MKSHRNFVSYAWMPLCLRFIFMKIWDIKPWGTEELRLEIMPY